MSGICAAEIRTRARTKVSKVALRLVDPFPAKVLSEVDVQRTHAAVLLQVPETVVGIQGPFLSLASQSWALQPMWG